MSPNTIPVDYANGLIFELEKAFWDERGRGARFRTTTIGREYLRDRCLPRIESAELEPMLAAIDQVLRDEGIAARVAYQQEDRLLRVQVEGCVHRPVEEALIAQGIEPFTCVPANLIVLAIEERLDRPVELAEIKLDQDGCHLLLILFDQRPMLR